jgi:hypothetical protein
MQVVKKFAQIRGARAMKSVYRMLAAPNDCHAGLVPPFCLSAAKSIFDAH